MSKEIYTCDACHYTFEAETGCDHCPDCGKKYHVFGDSHMEQIAKQHGISYTAELPIDPSLAAACDEGKIAEINGPWLDKIVDMLEEQ